MKIKQYRAVDMRQALRMIKDAQGPDAVILSSRKIPGGVEVVAAVDYDGEVHPDRSDSLHDSQHDSQRIRSAASQWAPESVVAGSAAAVPDIAHAAVPADAHAAVPADDYAALARRFAGDAGVEPAQGVQISSGSNVNEELRNLRRMLETQFATLAWNDLSRRAPSQTELLKQLTELGIAHDLAGELASQLPSKLELAEAHRLALALMARRIQVLPERWMESGGVVAMVGATGVGKTTLLSKLAARWVMQHGSREIALITTDAVRIGAQEQLLTLGRLLAVPAYAVDGPAELPELLDHLAHMRLVLIDTAGLSQRDPRLPGELERLAGASRLETTLVIGAAAQAGAIEEAAMQFAAARPASCVLTKLDEATSLGGALSMLMRSGLPLAYISDGQRVPEDLHPARVHRLIARAVELSRRSGAHADEDLLSRRFGSVAHALA